MATKDELLREARAEADAELEEYLDELEVQLRGVKLPLHDSVVQQVLTSTFAEDRS